MSRACWRKACALRNRPPETPPSHFREHGDDLARHRIDDENLMFEFQVRVLLQLRHLIDQWWRKRVWLERGRDFRADRRIEALGRFRRLHPERHFGVFSAQRLLNLAALGVGEIERRYGRIL